MQWKHGISGSKVHAQLYSICLFSSMLTPLLSTGLRIELQLLFNSEMGISHALTLTVGGCPFVITVTKHFRPNPGHSNERLFYKPIDRALEIQFQKGSLSFLQSNTPEIWKILKHQFCCFLDKKIHKYKYV